MAELGSVELESEDNLPGLQEFIAQFAPEEDPNVGQIESAVDLPLEKHLSDIGIASEWLPSTMMTLFIQVCLTTPAYLQGLSDLGVPENRLGREAEAIIVPFKRTDSVKYGIVILDPGYHDFPRGHENVLSLPQMRAGLSEGFRLWHARREGDLRKLERAGAVGLARLQQMWRLLKAVDLDSLEMIGDLITLPLAVASLPTPQYTSTPTSPWEISGGAHASSLSTAGAVVEDTYGRVGVTGCNHALSSALGIANGVTVTVAGTSIKGTMHECDSISDSCFVELSSKPASNAYKTSAGALAGVSPRQNEVVTFEGVTSGLVTTRIQGWSPDLLFVTPYNQSKLFTDRVTDEGDSGAALVDGNGNILGFAFYRTGSGQIPALSAWMWAESVFSALNLTAL